jgi:sialidase-1
MAVSSDGGNTFSRPYSVHESNRRWNCPRLSVVDGELWVICDLVDSVKDPKDYFEAENDPEKTQVFLTKIPQTTRDGLAIDRLIPTNITGILPDRITRTPDGHLITTTHTMGEHGHLVANAWIGHSGSLEDFADWCSMDKWEKHQIVWDANIDHCEGSIFSHRGTLYCFLRSHCADYSPGYYVTSVDGKCWSAAKTSLLFGCHRPTAGVLDSGNLLVTYRRCMSMESYYWARSTMACWIQDMAPTIGGMGLQKLRELDFDRHMKCDSGYTGWCQLPKNSEREDGGEIIVVNYIKDDAPTPHIRWYRFKEAEFFGE